MVALLLLDELWVRVVPKFVDEFDVVVELLRDGVLLFTVALLLEFVREVVVVDVEVRLFVLAFVFDVAERV